MSIAFGNSPYVHIHVKVRKLITSIKKYGKLKTKVTTYRIEYSSE